MKKNNVLTKAVLITAGLPAVLLALVLTACSTGSEKEEDPVLVDLTLPPIQGVANFSGNFVSSEAEAQTLVQTAFAAIENMLDTPSFQSSSVSSVSQSVSRSVHREPPYEKIFDHDETVLPDAEVTGFVQGRQTASVADDNNPGGTVGDSMEGSGRAKLAIDFDNIVRQRTIFINGEYSVDENMYYKMMLTAANTGNITISYNVSAQYALSISDISGGPISPGRGLKLVMKIQGRINKTIQGDESALDNLDNMDMGSLFDTYMLSLDIYDKDNVKKDAYSYTFTSYATAAAYLGL
jgi:hypothetical protein